MNKMPKIGICGSLVAGECKILEDKERSYVMDDYVQAVYLAGGAPLILPIISSEKTIEIQMENIDGLILPGGEDINPVYYKEIHHNKLANISPRLDAYEMILLKIASRKKIPILGICRGMQFINVFFGGNLYQDNSLHIKCWIKHCQECLVDSKRHQVSVKKGSWLHSIFGDDIVVNSFHHQSINELAEGFTVTANSKDELIEGIEKIGDPFCVGVQWHPELLAPADEKMSDLFKSFVSVCNSEIS